ncbi:pre-peptidase C-terminal domain-containing protein [Paracoccus sp. DMF-8]|uniref:pre-peptidase C-terminal domain-containing protein n=1 Tax=Paracoccus sp. DMF-8 TaxID=3019445 RepID=UPI0023E36003|nr:pre-peptidase C-terminal domain-containing protein [Paracoccus sp. DMF-8]MDF3607815.1 pre-peptidase C-terminal domain-containing protein [Paracoccus sp. DMF-8]
MPDIPGNSTTTAVITGTGDFRSSLETNMDPDWWRVELTAGLTYNFYLIGDGTGTDIYGTLRLRDGLGGSINAANDGSWMTYTATSTGTYFIEVADLYQYNTDNGNNGAEGPYVIRTQMSDRIVNSSSTTAAIARSGSINGNLEANNDSDWYRVELVAGQRVGFSVTPNGSLTFDSATVRIHDQYGAVLASASDGAGNQATYTIGTTGTYYVSVSDSNIYDTANGNGGAEGAFTLISRISDNVANNNTTTSRLIDGGMLRGNIDAYGDSDWHAFSAVAGRTYTFTMTGTGGADSLASMVLFLRDGSGASLASRTGYTSSGGSVITWTASTTGTYYLDASYRDYSTNNGAYNLSVVSNSPTINGTAANDVLNGGANANTMRGGGGSDRIFGNAGNDTLYGELGNDSLSGGDGNDVLIGGLGNDLMNGGAGIDTVNFAGGVAVTVDLTRTGPQATGYGNDTIINVENVVGGNGADRLIGNANANMLTGGGGNDTLNGGAGNDALNGGVGNDTLLGGAGNDTLNGGAGNDVLNGGAGIDTAVYSDNAAIRVNLGLATAQATGQGQDTLLSIENVTTGGGNDRLTGNAAANRLVSGAGNDTLSGGAGNDTLDGGLGNDVIDGGAGIDTLLFSGAGAVRVNLGATAAQNTGRGLDTIRNMENVTGSTGNDVLTGNAAANRLEGAGGNDRLFGGMGHDTLIGGAGNDRLVGGFGNDVLTGGLGADIFVFGRNEGSDRILDWQDGTDLIHINASGASYADLSVQQVGQNTQISFDGTVITLVGVSSWSIYTSDFIFN